MDPVLDRAGRLRVGAPRRVDEGAGGHAGAAVDLLLRPRLRLLHVGLPRHEEPQGDRREPGVLRDRLPAHRHVVAVHQGRGRAACARASPTSSSTRSSAATPSTCSASTSPEIPLTLVLASLFPLRTGKSDAKTLAVCAQALERHAANIDPSDRGLEGRALSPGRLVVRDGDRTDDRSGTGAPAGAGTTSGRANWARCAASWWTCPLLTTPMKGSEIGRVRGWPPLRPRGLSRDRHQCMVDLAKCRAIDQKFSCTPTVPTAPTSCRRAPNPVLPRVRACSGGCPAERVGRPRATGPGPHGWLRGARRDPRRTGRLRADPAERDPELPRGAATSPHRRRARPPGR